MGPRFHVVPGMAIMCTQDAVKRHCLVVHTETDVSVAILPAMRSVLLLGFLTGALLGCGRGQTPIPAGAQEVHVTVSGAQVDLEPATVRAGDIFVVLDTPGSSVGFAQRQRTANETPGPLTDEDLARLAHGDTQGTSIGGFDDAGCSAEQRAEDRGLTGPCGNVFKWS